MASFMHDDCECNGVVMVEVSNLFKISGTPVFTPEGVKITSIKFEDIFKSDDRVKTIRMRFYCRNCQLILDIGEVLVECAHCLEYFNSDKMYALTGTGGYYCEDGKKLFEDDVTIDFIKIADCVEILTY